MRAKCKINAMNDEQQQRYSRHVLLPQIGVQGQERLLAARVFILGAGGLGSPVTMYLASAGVGHLVLADFDHVDLSNLQRQILHGVADLGADKVSSARDTIAALNPGITVTTLNRAPDDDELDEQIGLADVVVDACDNFDTRFSLNRFCVKHATPLVSAAAVRFEGQISVFDSRDSNSPCYRCLYSDDSSEGEACSQVGVLAPLLGIIGSTQAVEVIKLIVGIGESLAGRVMMLDALGMEWRTLKLRKDPACPVCGK
jgi:molybdopterin/thiamine biosynthesis adenylyltransferase